MARQDEYDQEFLEYEDPAIYKALMQQEASERPAPIVSDDTPYFQNPPDNVYMSGEGRRDARDFVEKYGISKEYAKLLFGGDQNRNLGLGALDLALVNPSLDMVDSWKFYNKINRARDEIENQMAEEGWGSKYSREYYYKDKDGKIQNKYEDELKRRMPEFQKMGTSFLEGIAAPFEAITAGTLGKLPKGYKVAKAYAGENLGSLGELLTKYGTPTSLGGTAAYGSIPENKEIDKETALRIYKAMMKP